MEPIEEVAFRDFVALRSAALLHTATLLTGDRESAQDLVQEALTRLVGRWQSVGNPEAYVRTTMHRLQISRWRHRSVLREDPAALVPDVAQSDRSAHIDDQIVVARALDRLTPRQRSVLVCRDIEDLDERQTAARLGLRVGSVRSIRHRALRRLQELCPELALGTEVPR